MDINIKLVHPDAVIPSYSKNGDACFDLTAASTRLNGKFIEHDTGVAFEIPEGYVGLVFPRSSVTNKDVMLKNSVGIIDSGYRGTVTLRFYAIDYKDRYENGDRVGQMMIIPVPKVRLNSVIELSDSERGESGYGSTGR